MAVALLAMSLDGVVVSPDNVRPRSTVVIRVLGIKAATASTGSRGPVGGSGGGVVAWGSEGRVGDW